MQNENKEFLDEETIWKKIVRYPDDTLRQKTQILMNKTIVFIGDSITAEPRGNYCGYLASRLSHYIDVSSINFINSGALSDTTVHVLDRLPDLLEDVKPDISVIALGVNDSKYLRKLDRILLDADTFEANLRAIVKRIQADSDSSIILVTPTPVDFNHVFHDGFWQEHYYWKEEVTYEFVQKVVQVARSLSLKAANAWSAFQSFGINMLLRDDRVHPNQLGQMVIAATILEKLVEE